MKRDYAVFLRGITNVPMQPFHASLERLGLSAVDSFGASGNLMFCADGVDPASLETPIAEAIGAEAFVRGRAELASIVQVDPYAGRQGD